MSVNDHGIRLWNEAGQIIFDTTDYSGQWVGTLTINGATGYTPIRFAVPGVPDGSYVWAVPYYYNAEYWQYEASVAAVTRTEFDYNIGRAPAGCVTMIHYGFM
ncbi:hypothetical protein AX777_18225 [Sphingobium yanoikuyae]|uniref:Uncharacterized protein n=1 Tax=Sphingobium yanoikuyae TaxID=13690 RepID=A0A177J8A3_SPHYA|nr:hypothetical protein [Sphingobium yanoikuyae]OAH36976.1 hypothetical protein AX777_18225 [Sphingobium yanoikuyae]